MPESNHTVKIYTDGSACSKTKTGGWGFVALHKDKIITAKGGAINTTVNQMEQMAALMALCSLQSIEAKYCNRCLGIRHLIKPEMYNRPYQCDTECNSGDFQAPRLMGTQKCEIYSDSKYLVNGMNEYLFNWQVNNYKNHEGTQILNSYMWVQLAKMNKIHVPDWYWVKGHAGDKYNEVADLLAGAGRKRAKAYLEKTIKKNSTLIFDMQDICTHAHEDLEANTLRDFVLRGKFIYKTRWDKKELPV